MHMLNAFEPWSPFNLFTNACHFCQSGMWLLYTKLQYAAVQQDTKLQYAAVCYCVRYVETGLPPLEKSDRRCLSIQPREGDHDL